MTGGDSGSVGFADAIIEALACRDYAVAFSRLSRLLGDRPHLLTQAEVWARLFNGPAWFDSRDEPETYLEYATDVARHLCGRLRALGDAQLRRSIANAFVNGAHFRLAAHSEGDPRPLMRARAELFGIVLEPLAALREFEFPAPAAATRMPRLGVLFRHLAQDPETTSVLPFFEDARAHGIEVVLFVGSDWTDPAFADYVVPRCDRVARLADGLPEAITQLRAADLDILLFGNDITAKPSLFAYLSFFRLARISCCCVSTLVTTASQAVDVYFGCPYYESLGFATQFQERFVALPDPGFAFSIPNRASPDAVQVSRQQLGLRDDQVVIASGANFWKLHRGLLEVWATILNHCENAVLLLYPFPPHFGGTREDVAERVRRHFAEFGVDSSRIVIVSTLPRDTAVAMLRVADIGLDSFPYTGVTTIVDAVEAGLPTVTLRGHALRSSQGAAILHSAGLTGLIAESVDAYESLAGKLLLDSDFRSRMRAEVADAALRIPKFFRAEEFSAHAARAYLDLHCALAAGAGTLHRRAPVAGTES